MNLSNFQKMDVNMLLSIVNMKLRDEFDTLDELCRYYDIEKSELEKKLISGNYTYNKAKNFFG
jgi:hypothetical protein